MFKQNGEASQWLRGVNRVRVRDGARPGPEVAASGRRICAASRSPAPGHRFSAMSRPRISFEQAS
jgi:hypothetical protein